MALEEKEWAWVAIGKLLEGLKGGKERQGEFGGEGKGKRYSLICQ